MSKFLKITLVFHILVAVVFGLPLLGMPGRFLDFFGWAPVDPLISRMLGAAFLGMAWIDLRALRNNTRQLAQPAIEVGAVFCTLTAAGMLWHLKSSYWPWMVWAVLGMYILMAALWLWNWVKK